MRLDLPRMLLAAVALTACFTLPNAQAATSRQSAIPEEAEELSGDGWQLLSVGEPTPKAPSKKPVPASKQATAPSSSKQVTGSSSEPSTTASIVAQTEPTAAAVTASPPPVSAPITYSLVAGESVESQLLAWAKRAQWNVLWSVQDAWVVPGNKDYGTDFESAVQRVTEDLAVNGADILGDSWRGNRTIVITQNGAAGQ